MLVYNVGLLLHGHFTMIGTKSGQNWLTVARFLNRTEALGPGRRAVIWFHGCAFDCPGCVALEMNRSTDFERISPCDLAARVASVQGIEGVTLSGGDPFDQPLESLAEFLETLSGLGALGVMCYTGRTLSQLRGGRLSVLHERILSMIDILVDGLYVEELNDGATWRGSSNQQIHFLSPRYRKLDGLVQASRERRVEVTLSSQQELAITGIPPSGFMERLRLNLAASGYSMLHDDASEGNSEEATR